MTLAASRLVGVGMALTGLGLAWLGADDASRLVRDWMGYAPLLSVRTGSAAALPVAVVLLIVARLLLVPIAPDRDRALRLHFAALLAMLSLALVLPALLFGLSSSVLPTRGYQRCPELRPARFLVVDRHRDRPARCSRRERAAP